MFLKSVTDFFRTVSFRLTLWYALLFGISSLVIFFLIYYSLSFRLRKQTDRELLSKAKEFTALYHEQGIKGLGPEFQREANSRGIGRVFFALITARGDILISSDMRAWRLKILPVKGLKNKPAFRTIFIHRHRRARLISMPISNNRVLVCGVRLRQTDIIQEKLRETFGTAFVTVLILGGLAGYFISRRAMSGVKRVTKTALQIQQMGDLSKRVSSEEEGLEIRNLVDAFNKMLDRIGLLIGELKEVTDNIAHDLRSPITRIRGAAETTLMGNGSLKEFKEMAARVIEESDRLIGMINMMLEITRMEAGVLSLSKERLNINELIEDAVDLFYPLAEDKHIEIDTKMPSDPVLVHVDRSWFQRVIANLLDNAIKYTSKGGRIIISVACNRRYVSISIEDTGIGIREEDLPHIFKRFYRAEQSRTSPGMGLGLSLVKAVVEAHGGRVEVKSIFQKGSRFQIVLPA